MKKIGMVLTFVLACLAGEISASNEMQPRQDGNNIALEKKYTLSPKPNYDLCTDPDDARQLTDGQVIEIDKDGRYWSQKSVVGWRNKDITVKIDLEQVYPIEKIALHTVGGGGGGGVYFPQFISIFTSLDDKTYYNVANLTHLYKEIPDQQPGSYTRWFASEKLQTKGRYVLLKIKATGIFFCDEIIVEKGGFNVDEAVLTDKPHATEDKLESIVNEKNLPPLRAMLNNLAVFQEKLEKFRIDRESVTKFNAETARIKGDIGDPAISLNPAGRAGINERTTKLFCRLYKHVYPGKKLIVWQKGLWDDVEPFTSPEPGENTGLDELKVAMGKNEYGSASFLIFNPTAEDAGVELKFPDIKGICLEKRYGYYVYPALEKIVTADALPLLAGKDGKYGITVPAGETKQIWLTLKTGKDATAGDYSGKIEITESGTSGWRAFLASMLRKFSGGRSCGDRAAGAINLKVKILPLEMPLDALPSSANWAYLFKGPFENYYPGLEKEVADDNLSHYTTHFTVSCVALPFPEFNTNGMVGTVDFNGLDRQLEYIDNFNIMPSWWAGGKGVVFADKLQWLSPEWKKALKTWLTAWVEHLQEKGIDYDKFTLSYDEPESQGAIKRFIEFASAVKEIDPNIKICVYFYSPRNWSEGEINELSACIDIACVNFYHDDLEKCLATIATLKKAGVAIWHYNNPCANKSTSPYAFIHMFLFAVKYDLNGVATWAYNAVRGKSFNDFDGMDALFSYDGRELALPGNKGLIPSKRWEAWREGAQIYAYCNKLERLAEAVAEKGATGLVSRARETLAGIRNGMTLNQANNLSLCNPDDYEQLQREKIRVMEEIMEFR